MAKSVNTDTAKTQEQWARYVFMRDYGHEDFLKKAEKCDRFLVGDQWEAQDLARLNEQRRPAITINKTMSTVATLLGEQIQNRAEVNFRPKGGAPTEVADALNKVWLQISANNQLQWLRSDVFLDGIVRSRGFYDVRLSFDDSMRGEVAISQFNSKNVLIDPDATSYDPSEWNDVMLTKWLSEAEIGALYGKAVAAYLRDKSASTFYSRDSVDDLRDRYAGDALRGQAMAFGADEVAKMQQTRRYRMLDRQYRVFATREFFVDNQTGDMREVPESWDDNRIAHVRQTYGLSVIDRMVKRIKWCVTIDDVVAFDSWSPYKRLTVVPYFPYLRYGRTAGVVENILGPQELLNKSVSQELHIINTSANSGWKIKAGALRNMSIEELEANGARTGLVMELAETADAEKITPNMVPTGIDRITYKAEEFIKSISNVSDSMQGFDREDVAAKAIAYKQQRSSVNFSKVFDNLERSDYLLAVTVLDLIQEFYTEERVINITHEDPAQQPEEITINQSTPDGTIANDLTLGEYDVTITSAPFRATLEDSQFEQARAMREIGVQIPDTVLVENSRLTRKTELIKQMTGQMDTPEAQKDRELQARSKEAEVVKLEAEARERQAETELKMARTQREINDANPNPAVDPAMAKVEAEMALEREKMAAEQAMEREKMDMERENMALKAAMDREKMEGEMQLKREMQEAQIQLDRETMERDMAIKEAVAIKQASAAEAQAKAAAQAPAAGKSIN